MDRGPSGWIGSVLQERWRIDAKIARGGVATVYKGFDLETRTKVAVKIMHPEFSRNQDARGRFMREGYVANKIGHPLVVKVLADAALPDGTVFLVMELLEHGELLEAKRERLGGQMPAPEVVRIGDQILDVLVAAHNQDIVHRDIKPENLFVLDDGTVKVLDFGIAHLREAATRSGHESTATGLLLGTPDFMSPEQAMGVRGTIDAASDIYAVGATMFTLLSGEAVHTDMSLAALVHSTSSKQARSLATTKVGPSLPAALVAVIDKALMLQKIHRWPSARAMQNALRDAVPSAQPIKGPPESAKTRPFSPIDLKPVASVRSSGKPPRPSVAPRPPTKAPPPPKPPPLEPDLSDIHTTQAMTGELLAALPSVQASLPPLPPRDLGRTGDHPSLPPPPADLYRTGDHPSLPPPPADLYRTGDHPSLPPPGVKATASMPPPPLRGSLPPPPQHPSFPPPPPAHGSLPPPYYSPSQPPPPFVGPSTPRHQGWTTTDSGGVGILQQQAPSIPPPLPTPAPLVTGSDVSRQRKRAAPPKPPSIIIAEIVLALLVVVTLTIGGCLLLQAR